MAGKNKRKSDDLELKAIEAIRATEKTRQKLSDARSHSEEMKKTASMLRSRAYLNRTKLIEFKEEMRKNAFAPARDQTKQKFQRIASTVLDTEAPTTKIKKELKELSMKSFKR